MAETKTISKLNSKQASKQDYYHVTTGAADNTGRDDFVYRLYDVVDFYQLFDTFIDELGTAVPYDSIEYKNEDSQISLANGISARQCCSYELKYENQSLGHIYITRDTQFLENELETIEILLSGLALPLRNALSYQHAVIFTQRDTLTGLRNISNYYEFFEMEIKRAHRYKKLFSLLKINIDNFEDINHQYGNHAADEILYEAARRIVQQAHSRDIVYRNGGHEFLVFMPNIKNKEALIAANRIKNFIVANTFDYENKKIAFSLSAGVATVSPNDTASELVDRVDKALYNAKMLGENRVYGELSYENMSVEFAS